MTHFDYAKIEYHSQEKLYYFSYIWYFFDNKREVYTSTGTIIENDIMNIKPVSKNKAEILNKYS